jgi:hypothetical protein
MEPQRTLVNKATIQNDFASDLLKMQDDELVDEERRSDMSDDQFSNGMDEEDNFDFLIKRTQEKTNKMTEDILGSNG